MIAALSFGRVIVHWSKDATATNAAAVREAARVNPASNAADITVSSRVNSMPVAGQLFRLRGPPQFGGVGHCTSHTNESHWSPCAPLAVPVFAHPCQSLPICSWACIVVDDPSEVS